MESSSGSSESTMTSSWVLLDSNFPTAKDDGGKIENQKIEIACGQTPSTDSKDNINDLTNNKSDAESDGISIISESEFFNGSSDEDDSISSNENVTNISKKMENEGKVFEVGDLVCENQYDTSNTLKDCLELSETKQNSKTEELDLSCEHSVDRGDLVSFVDNDSVITETMNLCEFPKETVNCIKKFPGNENNRKIMNWTLKDISMTILQLNVLFFTGAILFALLASYLQLKTNENNISSPEKKMNSKPKINCDKSESPNFYEYCCKIDEDDEIKQDDLLERCMEELLMEMKKLVRYKREKKNKQSTKLTATSKNPGNEESNIISTKYRTNGSKENIENNYEMEKANISIKDFGNSGGKTKQPRTNKNSNRVQEKQFKQNKKKKELEKGKKIKSKKNEVTNNHKEGKLKIWNETPDRMEKQKRGKDDFIKKEIEYYESQSKMSRYNKKEYDDYQIKRLGRIKNKDKSKTKMSQTPPKNIKVANNKKKNETYAYDIKKFTGEWYMNLINSRKEIRKQDEKARWWFDRVNLRKIKRDKAYWYFQYSFNREYLRYKQKYL